VPPKNNNGNNNNKLVNNRKNLRHWPMLGIELQCRWSHIHSPQCLILNLIIHTL
jgi:hypothetical protein